MKDSEMFNKGEKHEVDYVLGLYPKDKRDEIREIITGPEVNRFTHEKLYALLESKGYKKSK